MRCDNKTLSSGNDDVQVRKKIQALLHLYQSPWEKKCGDTRAPSCSSSYTVVFCNLVGCGILPLHLLSRFEALVRDKVPLTTSQSMETHAMSTMVSAMFVRRRIEEGCDMYVGCEPVLLDRKENKETNRNVA